MVDCVCVCVCVCVSLSQGEVGEPGQKGSKADKGEQVRYGKQCPIIPVSRTHFNPLFAVIKESLMCFAYASQKRCIIAVTCVRPFWDVVRPTFFFFSYVQGPPGPAGLQGPIGAPGPAVSTLQLSCTAWMHLL